ncbi:MAG TPA: alpha/beta hydrolase family protein [Phnomibacter sp.]|nr:alpha/beta hydrolase family protein [Phnomibacter sp.]
MATHHIYCISGLAADFRIFSQLKVKDAILHPIEWQMPEEGESLPSFAAKLARQILHEDPVLLGVSFGGMLATEISKLIPVKKVIIVSSGKHRRELPRYMRLAGRLGLHKVVPYHWVTRWRWLNRFIFDARSRSEELMLKRMMLAETQVTFIRRSVHMILTWQGNDKPVSVVHIHGRRDRLLLPGPVKADHWINEGGHFMIWNMADRVSAIIEKELDAG